MSVETAILAAALGLQLAVLTIIAERLTNEVRDARQALDRLRRR